MRKISYFTDIIALDLNSCSKAYKCFRLERKTMEKQPGLRVFFPDLSWQQKNGWSAENLTQIPAKWCVKSQQRTHVEFGKSLVALRDMTVSKVWAHVNKEADGASKLWTESPLMKLLYHGVSGDGKWALRLLKGGRAIFPLGKTQGKRVAWLVLSLLVNFPGLLKKWECFSPFSRILSH